MQQGNDLRLIEDYLPIEAISKEASREKSVRKGHISTLHLWWARRPLVACRAAVYGALVPADRWVKDIDLKNPPADVAKAEAFKQGAKRGLNRIAAKEFVTKLCRYPKTNPTSEKDIKVKRDTEAAIVEAQRHILEAHVERLTAELAEALKLPLPAGGEGWGEGAPGWLNEFKWPRDKTKVTYDDILAGRAPRPRVLDMFAGGGAIPLEALRLGCEAYALDLNPVAHIIELCTLVYPQKYGKPDPAARGMTGPPAPLGPLGERGGGEGVKPGETTWGGLAAEVRYWGNWVLERVRKEIGDLYPPIPDPEVWATPPEIAFDRETGQWNVTKPGKPKRGVKLEDQPNKVQSLLGEDDGDDDVEDDESSGSTAPGAPALPPGFLQPVAYLWTRTVRCKNPSCAATVPLVRQTWLCKRPGKYVALRLLADRKRRCISFEVVQSPKESGLGFDPVGEAHAGNAVCPVCGTVADVEHVRFQGHAGQLGSQPMAVVCVRHGTTGKVFLPIEHSCGSFPESATIRERIDSLTAKEAIEPLDETIEANPRSMDTHHFGIAKWSDLFGPRQLLCLHAFSVAVRNLSRTESVGDADRRPAVATFLACWVDRLADFNSALCTLKPGGERGVVHTFTRHSLPMVWDYAEANPFGTDSANAGGLLEYLVAAIASIPSDPAIATVSRGSALNLSLQDASLDAVITDPPYYDNVSYSNLSDFFFIWLRRSIGELYPEHFATKLTPKKAEAIAAAYRHDASREESRSFYESSMLQAFKEANRIVKPGGQMTVVYAHKTTLGWATLVDALRAAGFVVTEAWPLDTEMKSRIVAMETAALASSIFLVARKRMGAAGVGNYEDDVQPELQQIVRERVETLWEMGIAGADLVIACVGAGLRAFTKYEKVEYANGEEVPAKKFLAEVEGVVLDTMMGKLMAPLTPTLSPRGERGTVAVSAIDPASRFYVLWRFVYKAAEIDAGEAIVFTYSLHVELDGPLGLSTGKDALVEKKKAKYRARDFTERGDNDKLGLPDERQAGKPVPLIDVLHRVLWLVENSPRKLGEFLIESGANRERLRILAQTLAGAALSGKRPEDAAQLIHTTTAEQAALAKLLANWRSVVEGASVTPTEVEDRRIGQKRLFKGSK